MQDCIFCKIVKGEIPCVKVYEDADTVAFMDINPASEGHTLVIPKNHSENLDEISPEDLVAVHRASQTVLRGIRKSLNPSGVAVLQLNGRGVGQLIMHYHVHLIPRAQGGPELVVSRMGAKSADAKDLKQTAERIAGAIDRAV